MADPVSARSLPTELRAVLQQRSALPAFPTSIERLLELVHGDAGMQRIAHEVEKDPAIATRVLKVANSAFYGLSRQVATLDLAVVLLGLRNISNIVLGVGFVQMLSEHELHGGYPGRDFLDHSVEVGRLARYLARHRSAAAEEDLHGEEFVAGLVHDIGKLVLLRAFPDRVDAEQVRLAAARGSDLAALEVELFGVDHAQVGAWAAAEWRLPELIVAAIAAHHDANVAAGGLAELIAAADWAARWLGTAEGEHAAVFPPDSPAAVVMDATTYDLSELRAACLAE